MGAGPRLDGEHSSEFVQHPGLGRGEPLKVTLGSTGHFDLLLLKESQPVRYNKYNASCAADIEQMQVTLSL